MISSGDSDFPERMIGGQSPLSRMSNLPTSIDFCDNQHMLVPSYSLRTVLLGITGSAVFFLIATQALLGQAWAIVITAGGVGLIVTLLFHTVMNVLTSFLSRIVGTQETPAMTSQGGLQANSDLQTPPSLNDRPE